MVRFPPLEVLPPVEERRGVVPPPGDRMGDVGVGHPGDRRELEHVVAQGAREVLLLFRSDLRGDRHVVLQSVRHRNAHHLEELRLPVEPGERCIHPVKQRDPAVHEAVPELLNGVGALRDGVDERQGEGEPPLPRPSQKVCDVQQNTGSTLSLKTTLWGICS